jgi:DNA ligase-1
MKQFAQLIETIDHSNKTNVKVDALADYFKAASDSDKVWTIAILSHRRPPRPVNSTLIRHWASEYAKIPLWLFEESYHIVGDLAETIALVLPDQKEENEQTLSEIIQDIIDLKSYDEADKKQYMLKLWNRLNYYERFVFNKLITGGFRIGVSQKLMTRALSKATAIEEDVLAFKLMGDWNPNQVSFDDLILSHDDQASLSRPYPFYLAYAIEDSTQEEKATDYYFEHKWDGIRAQIILREDKIFIWSRGEELVTDRYPELHQLKDNLPKGCVLDGEILPYPNNELGSFKDLQQRIGRKKVSKKLLKDVPVIFKTYDLLEDQAQDIRALPFHERRNRLEEMLQQKVSSIDVLQLTDIYTFSDWSSAAKERARAREIRSEGLMVKKKDGVYRGGRKKGDWWKWKSDPFTIDAVLIYAMRGHGRRSNLFTDYTFAVWDDEKKNLITFAKAYSGLTDKEFRQVDAWIKKNTIEKFGPIRSVTPHHVFEIAFEGIAYSKRHKSGVATRFPRIHRWRMDKPIKEANTLAELKEMIPD